MSGPIQRRSGSFLSVLTKTTLIKVVLLGGFLTPLQSPLYAAFQEALWGARPASMAGAYTAIADDSNAPIYNPAGISLIPGSELTITYAQLFSGLDFQVGDDTSRLGLGYLSYVPNIQDRKYGSFGISWANFVASNLLREDTFTLTYADSYQFDSLQNGPILSYGTNVKLLKRSFSTDSRTDIDPVFAGGRESDAVALDLGLMFRPHFEFLPGLKLGMAAQNFNEPDIGLAQKDRVPARYAFGIAYQDKQLRWLNPSIDVARRNGRTLISLAYEGWFSRDAFALRAGGNEDQLGAGAGYQFRLFSALIMRLDYALIWPLNIEGTNGSHRISVTTNF